jgi:hypothetical protein
MEPTPTLSRSKLAAFNVCRRRFQLRYRRQLAWPLAPGNERNDKARHLGERFHQLLHRHFLGLPPEAEPAADKTLQRWWAAFKEEGPSLPPGHRYPEFALTVPAGKYLLTGRFDLLILSDQSAHIFDWKTESRPHSEDELRDELQTRLYLALLAAGSDALGQTLSAGQVAMTYWYANAPQAPVTLRYDEAWHEANWTELQQMLHEMAALENADSEWPLTDNVSHCAHCLYQVYCGRLVPGSTLAEWERDERPLQLEPDWS